MGPSARLPDMPKNSPCFRRPGWCALAFLVVLVLGCSRDEAPEALSRPATVASQAAPGSGSGPAPAVEEAAQEPTGDPPPPAGRRVIHAATLSVRTEDPRRAAQRAAKLSIAAGGYVANQNMDGAGERIARVDMVLRVPAEKLTAVLGSLRGEGKLLSESMTGEDITTRYADLGAQLRAKRRLEERLLELLARTGAIKDVLEAEKELARVRAEIERLEGQTRRFDQLVRFATIEVSWLSPEQPIVAQAESFSSRLGRAFANALSAAETVLLAVIVALGVLVPVSVPVAGVFWWIRRRRLPETV